MSLFNKLFASRGPAAAIEQANRQTERIRRRFQADVRAGKADPEGYQTLKHEHPYHGYVDCGGAAASFTLFSANDDVVAWEYFWTGTYEPSVVCEWERMVADADMVLDIGAYTGCMALIACKLNSSCEVHCFEAMPRTVERLQINVRSNGFQDSIHLHPYAVAEHAGRIPMNMPRPVGFLGTGNSLGEKPGVEMVDQTDVECVRLDDYLPIPEGRRVSCLKLDIEGAEIDALEGMRSIVSAHRPEAFVEVWPAEKQRVVDYFEAYGYTGRRLQGLNWLFTPQ